MNDNSSIPPLGIRLFGGFEVRVDGEPLPALRSRREQWLLALLALRTRQETARDWLATTLWQDADESQALFYLRKSLSNLRTALGTQSGLLLSPSPRTVRLDLHNAFADFLELEAVSVSPNASQARRENAVGLYSGVLLPECNEEWIFPERERFAQIHLTLLETLSKSALDAGEPSVAVRWLRRVVSADPYRENAHQRLMQALADCGDLAAVGQVYRELRVRLHSELNTTPSPETEKLYHRLREQPTQAVVRIITPTETASRRHLPVPLTDLIGREAEIAEVTGWLSHRRLATLLGSGGIGKTRMAIGTGEAVLPLFSDGVWFVDFAVVTDPQQVPAITAKTLGIPDTPNTLPENVLAERLATQNLLLIFDNCEHILDAAAVLSFNLLTACPQMRILATSRQALGVTGEQVIPVSPLAFPPPYDPHLRTETNQQEKDPLVLMEYPAVRLFVERAIQSDPTFRLTRKNQNTVVTVVQELDGIPLAIEMAAARLRSFSLTEIEARLTDRLRLLTTGNRGGRPRQQTLRATIDWSHDLLTEAEQSLLRRLSVFSGGWTQDAAQSVCFGAADASDGAVEVSDLCAELHSLLIEKSLIVRELIEDETRFRMLVTVREYAAERLEVSGEADAIKRRHLAWCFALAEAMRNGLNGTDDTMLMAKLDRNYANVRAALEFARTGECLEEGLKLLYLLHPYWTARGMMREGEMQCKALLEHLLAQARTTERAAALRVGAWMAHYQNHFAESERLGEECLAIYQELGDKIGECYAFTLLAAHAAERGQTEKACRLAAESVTLRREMNSALGLAASLNVLGECLQLADNLAGARETLAEALALRREHGSAYLIAASLYALGRVHYDENDFAQAGACCGEALSLFQQAAAPFWASATQIQLGWIAMKQERFDAGIAWCRVGLEAQRTIETPQFISLGLDALAEAACHFNQWERVARLHGAANKLRQDSGCLVLAMESRDQEQQALSAQNALGEEAYRKFAALSNGLTFQEIFELAWEEDATTLSRSRLLHLAL